VIENKVVADGSLWLVLEAADDLPAAFEPGHVLGLGLKLNDGSLMRHAYTVSRGTPSSNRFEHLYRVISGGRMSQRLAALSTADIVYFHGPFHTPIQQEVCAEAGQIVLVSTGVGIGPLYGYSEKTLNDGERRPIGLLAGFREQSDTCLASDLEVLSRRHSNFSWQFTLTRPADSWGGLRGRVTDHLPETIDVEKLSTYHFHLVGNGEMVHLVRRALATCGVSPHRVSIETYFNHYFKPPSEDIDRVAARLSLCRPEAREQ